MAEQEEFAFDVNDAAIYFDGTDLKVAYGEGMIITVSMSREDKALTKQVLAMGDFWTAFLGGLSNSVDKVRNGQTDSN